MRRPVTLAVLVLGAASCATSGEAPAPPGSPHGESGTAPVVEGRDFAVYRSDGSPASLDAVLAATDEAEAVLVGEEHDDFVGHRVQLRLLEGAFLRHGNGEGRGLVLSLEMFERDVQLVVDEYLDDLITEEHFLSSARPWDNYREAYRPLVEFARAHGMPVVAANAPRRYVNRASRLGRESLGELSDEARADLPPLPYPEASDAYRSQWDSLMGDAAGHMSGSPLDGQTLWDAAMGHAVARALEARPGSLVLHVAGGFHVESHTGVPETLDHYRPGTRTVVVAIRTVEGPDLAFDPAEHEDRGDFVILTSDDPPGGGAP